MWSQMLQGLAIQSFYLSFRRQYPGANWAWWSLQCSHDSVSSATAGPATRASLLWEWCVVRLPERKSQCRNPSWSDWKIRRAGKRLVGMSSEEEFYIKKSTRMIETKATFLSGFLVLKSMLPPSIYGILVLCKFLRSYESRAVFTSEWKGSEFFCRRGK